MIRLERGLIVIGAGKIDLRRLLNGRGETIGSFGNTPTSGQRWNRGHEGGEASTLSAKRLAGHVGSIRLDAANTQELDYYLLPRLDLPDQEIRVSNKNSADFECFRFDDLNFFYGMSERERLQRRV